MYDFLFETISNNFKIDVDKTENNFDPQIVISTSDNHHFKLNAMLTSETPIDLFQSKTFILVNKNIKMLEYSTEVNSFFPTGTITYVDSQGFVGKMYNKGELFCIINIVEMVLKTDGEIKEFELKNDGKDSFRHAFVVSNIEILSRDNDRFTYRIYLTSILWYLCSLNLPYSNYDKISSDGKRGEYLGDALINLFSKCKLPIDTKSFKLFNNSVTFPFSSSVNDNIMSIYNYLMNRAYKNDKCIDESIKYLVFDIYENKYKIVDMSDDKTYLHNDYPSIPIVFRSTKSHVALYEFKNNMSSVSKKSFEDVARSYLTEKIWNFDRKANRISSNTSVKSEKFLKVANNAIKDLAAKKHYVDRFKPIKIFDNCDLERFNFESEWHTPNDNYNKMINDILYNDAVVINMSGHVRHQPGMIFQLGVPFNPKNPSELTVKEYKETIEKNKQLLCVWQSVKVRHIIYPSSSPFEEDENLPAIKENIVLVRNYIKDPTYDHNEANGEDPIIKQAEAPKTAAQIEREEFLKRMKMYDDIFAKEKLKFGLFQRHGLLALIEKALNSLKNYKIFP